MFEEGNLAVKRGYGELNRAEIDYTKRPLFDHIRAYGQIYLPFLMATDNFRRLQAKGLHALASRHDIQDDAVVQPNVE